MQPFERAYRTCMYRGARAALSHTPHPLSHMPATAHIDAIATAATDEQISQAFISLGCDLAAGASFHYGDNDALLRALDDVDPYDMPIPALWSAVRVAVAYGDTSGLAGLGFEVAH